MPNDDQAQADTADQTTVTDPLDAVNSTASGTTNAFSAYEAEVAAALADEHETVQQQEESADGDDGQAEEVANEDVSEDGNEEEEQAGEKSQERFRFKDAEDKAIAALAKATGKTLREAAKAYEALTGGEQSQGTAETQAAAATANEETAASVQARIEELEDLEAQSSSALEFETANEHRKEANKLRNKLIDLKIAEVQERSNANANAERKFYADFDASEQKSIQLYPDLLDAKSPLSVRVAELDREARELGDPNYHSENKPWILATAAAKELGVLMKKPAATAGKKPAVQSNRPIQTASGNASTTATDPTKRAAETIEGLRSMRDYDDIVSSL